MTGGQMAPTTILGMKTETCPYGRTPEQHGWPVKISKILSELNGVCYATRQTVYTPAAVRKAKKAIRKAFENSLNKKGTSIVEIVATCNSNWKMTPEDANTWMEANLFPEYPLGDIKDEAAK